MQISNTYPEFRETTMLLITSRQDALAYKVSGRNSDKLFSFHINKPEYSDKEGGFDRSGKNGQRVGGGETDINTSDIAYTEFLEQLTEQLDQITTSDIQNVILFATEHLATQTLEQLPNDIKSKITMTIHGNLINEELNDLVSRIHQS